MVCETFFSLEAKSSNFREEIFVNYNVFVANWFVNNDLIQMKQFAAIDKILFYCKCVCELKQVPTSILKKK